MHMRKYPIKKITSILDSRDIRHSWRDILYTHVMDHPPEYHYITEDDFFYNAEKLEEDIIANLTIGNISVLYEYSLAHYDSDSRKNKGQYFTPDDVSQLMSTMTENIPGIWLDPCSGVGNLSWHLANKQDNPEKFVENNLILSDIDELALTIARVLFTLSFQDRNKDLFNSIENNFIVNDYLNDDNLPEYNNVIMNPPYVSTQKDDRFYSAKARDTYSYFIEKSLSSETVVSVTPQSFLNSNKFSELREMIIQQEKDVSIIVFDNIPDSLFDGIKFGSKNTNKANSVRAAIMRITSSDNPETRTTPMIRWRKTQRKQLLSTVSNYLTNVNLTTELFPKLSSELSPLYDEIIDNKTIGDLTTVDNTSYKLYVPSTPRYYMSAARTPLKRSSMITLCFPDVRSMNDAYLIINSSYAYWWWTVVDGGMTLSRKTLLSTPLIDTIEATHLLEKIKSSEKVSKVTASNGGKIQENIRHPQSLTEELTRALLPDYVDYLNKTHSNSILG